MRNTPNMKVEKYRVTSGPYASDSSYGNNGLFMIPYRSLPLIHHKPSTILHIVVSDEDSWDHVSVHPDTNPPRCPTWEEMCYIKSLFFTDEETAIQFHPNRVAYINCHPTTLHLWRNQSTPYELPPGWMVGPKTEDELLEQAREWGIDPESLTMRGR